jgi:hypothetical protein
LGRAELTGPVAKLCACRRDVVLFTVERLETLTGLLVKPGTPEHRNTEHRNSIIPEHGTPEH